ncbi:hypothetical protein [Spirosoma endbachense]|uniref:DUF4968 domain-containing protein n=1 Tax=Spirosoma endbachense TaxID=2666025 RepID=A0A6P1VPC1_9BACT|nr:hypothetical protein [Spirosoma endbachense]QHV93820.1 hypothetical protein GJR95_01705 [Spirosoma endbachense]
MKTRLFFLKLMMVSAIAFCQSPATTRLYFVAMPANSFHTTLNPDKPIKIGRCTLLETNADSLGIVVTNKKTAYLHFERGRTYYFRVYGGHSVQSMTSLVSETEFWLDVGFNGASTYRHYFLDKEKGLTLLED